MRSLFRHRIVVTSFRLLAALVLIVAVAVGSVHHHGGTADRHSCPVCTAAGTVAVAATPAPRPEPPLSPLRPLIAPEMAATQRPSASAAPTRAHLPPADAGHPAPSLHPAFHSMDRARACAARSIVIGDTTMRRLRPLLPALGIAALLCAPMLATAQTSSMFSNLANPSIGMNALFSAQAAPNLDQAYGPHFDEAEISLMSVVDPYWTFVSNIVFAATAPWIPKRSGRAARTSPAFSSSSASSAARSESTGCCTRMRSRSFRPRSSCRTPSERKASRMRAWKRRG